MPRTAPEPAPSGRARCTSTARGRVQADVYRRDDLPAGARVEGPAVIDQLDSTTLVPPDVTAEVDEWLNVRMHIGTEGAS